MQFSRIKNEMCSIVVASTFLILGSNAIANQPTKVQVQKSLCYVFSPVSESSLRFEKTSSSQATVSILYPYQENSIFHTWIFDGEGKLVDQGLYDGKFIAHQLFSKIIHGSPADPVSRQLSEAKKEVLENIQAFVNSKKQFECKEQ